MPNAEFWITVLGVALVVISALSAIVWNMLRLEAQEHANLIKQKADTDELAKIEGRFKEELAKIESRGKDEMKRVEENSEKLIDKLQSRHEKELDALATRLGEQIKSTETNILSQMRLLFDMWKEKE